MKNFGGICVKRMCGNIKRNTSCWHVTSYGSMLLHSPLLDLARFSGGHDITTSANGPSSSGFWTAAVDHSINRSQSRSSLTANPSNLIRLAMMQPCVSRKKGDSTMRWHWAKTFLQNVRCNSTGRAKEDFKDSDSSLKHVMQSKFFICWR